MTNFLSLTKRFHHFAKLGQLQDTTDEISIWIKFRDSPIRTRRKEEEEKKIGSIWCNIANTILQKANPLPTSNAN